MAKGNGSSRASASSNPRGLTATQENIIAVNNAAFSRPILADISTAEAVEEERIPKRQDDQTEADWFSQNGNELSNRIQETINNRVIAGDNLAVSQLSRNDSGQRAIRVLHQGNPYSRSEIAKERDKKMRTIAERITKIYGIRAVYSVEDSRAQGYVGYISFPGWK